MSLLFNIEILFCFAIQIQIIQHLLSKDYFLLIFAAWRVLILDSDFNINN